MRTQPDCIPCFFRQALVGARLARPGDAALHERVLLELAALVGDLDLDQPPPAQAGRLYALLRRLTGVDDCFAEHKRQANSRVLELLPGLERLVRTSADRLATALEIAVVGNYIDAGVEGEFDWEGELSRAGQALGVDGLDRFRDAVRPGAEVLVVGDNAGEIGLDRPLVAELLAQGAKVTYAVRGRPVLNDATLEDARFVGLTELCEVISSGADTPGAVPGRCDEAFLRRLDGADLILAKGQGNYEALTGSGRAVYFAFKVKCPVVAARTGLPLAASAFLAES